jgi:glycosyltransferase involved in cell wall biosynthesis
MTHALPPDRTATVAAPASSGPARPHLALISSNGPTAIGGLASYVRHLAAELDESFQTSHVARFSAAGPTQLSYTARETPSDTLLDGRPVTTVAPPTAALPLLTLARRAVYYPSTQATARRLFRIGFEPAVARAVPREPAVVHSVGTGWEMLGFVALAIARRRGAAFCVTPAIHTGVWGDSELDARLYRSADAVFALSRHEADRLAELGVDPGRIAVTGLAPALLADGDAARFRNEHGLGDRPIVLFAGRKQRYKGYHALCEAMAEVRASVPDACLVALGPDGDRPYPDLPAGARLDLGIVDERRKADALAACDVFCMPSAEESFGIVYTEAWAYGKPVIGGSAPAVQELVRDGEDGYLVTPDARTIAERVVALLRDDGLRERLGASGRRRQQTEFAWSAVAERHVVAYRDALARVGAQAQRGG